MTTKTSSRLSLHGQGALPRRDRRHFLYRAVPPVLAQSDIDAVSDAVRDLMGQPRAVAGVALFVRRELEAVYPLAALSFDRLVASLGLDAENDRVSLLACEWASPHEDSSFCGSAFVSLVLRTGPSPYVMSMFHSRKLPHSRALDLVTTTRVLRTADVFVFDPATPHMAAPAQPRDGQLLVLLQAEVDISKAGGREKLLRRFARHAEDRDEQQVFHSGLESVVD